MATFHDKGEQVCTVLDENGDEVRSAVQAMTKAELTALLAKDKSLPKP